MDVMHELNIKRMRMALLKLNIVRIGSNFDVAIGIVRWSVSMVSFKNSSTVTLTRSGRALALAAMTVALLSACATSDPYDVPPSVPVPQMPVPIGPASNADLSKLPNIVFSWEQTEHATNYEFHIYNSLNSDIDRYMVKDLSNEENCHNKVCGIKVRLVLPDSRNHAWRVRAINAAGTSAWTRRVFTWDKNGFLDATYLDES
jgi:hypothetical protein